MVDQGRKMRMPQGVRHLMPTPISRTTLQENPTSKFELICFLKQDTRVPNGCLTDKQSVDSGRMASLPSSCPSSSTAVDTVVAVATVALRAGGLLGLRQVGENLQNSPGQKLRGPSFVGPKRADRLSREPDER